MGKGGSTGMGLSVLRALETNPKLCDEMPRWGSNDLKWSFGIAGFTFDRDSTSKLLEAAAGKLRGLQRRLQWPRSFGSRPAPAAVVVLPKGQASHIRFWCGPLTSDVLCEAQPFASPLSQEFAGRPLEALVKKHLVADKKAKKSTAGIEAVEAVLGELVALSAGGGSGRQTGMALPQTAQPGFTRLQAELKEAARRQASSDDQGLGALDKLDGKLNALRTDLLRQRVEDEREVRDSIQRVVELAHSPGSLAWLFRRGGAYPSVTFADLTGALMAAEAGATAALARVNASIGAGGTSVQSLLSAVAAVLARVVRMGQTARAQLAVEDLQSACAAKGRQSDAEIALRVQAVAKQLSSSRHFVKSGAQGLRYDPRFLVFEFLFDILLRLPQVQLLETFLTQAKAGRSMCHQMIMGAGKTTVVAPLLSVLLADGGRLVCVCMPAALLDMSRAVMTERLSSPILPRPVIVFHFQRHLPMTPKIKQRLEAARQARACVLATPTSLKSLLLRHLELLHNLHDLTEFRAWAAKPPANTSPSKGQNWLMNWFSTDSPAEGPASAAMAMSPEERSRVEEARLCSTVLASVHRGVLLLDEVDVLLDPLRSELNWPMGHKTSLELVDVQPGPKAKERQGLRYRLPFHILDLLFANMGGCPGSLEFRERSDAQSIVRKMAQAIDLGRKSLKLQLTPHLLLLSFDFYVREMLPLLVDWTVVWLEAHTAGQLTESELKQCLKEPGSPPEKLNALPQMLQQLVSLARHWLHCVLPFILSKVHRVAYGLLTGSDLEKAAKTPSTPPSRRLLAIPFVGKDTPSGFSEFSNADVTIGFTIMAYRLSGLRPGDVRSLLKVLVDNMRIESATQYHRRAACKEYVQIVVEAGGSVRGFAADGRWLGDLREEERRLRADTMTQSSSRNLSRTRTITEEEEADLERRKSELPALELVDLTDGEQLAIAGDLLHETPLAVRYFLEQHAFACGTLARHDSQLSASGQELAGPQLFGFCLGFSGTPNDLLPRSLGACHYAAGDDGEVMTALSNTAVVSAHEMNAAWTPRSLLNFVATARTNAGPKYHALIDTGALVTGMTNAEVAQYLLQNGLAGLHGVVFLNEQDERVVLLRDGMRIVDLAQSGLSPEQRFTFYDHVHTTGMDVKQPLTATACLTLSKDVTFRDYAQGAYRMRGLGNGQRIELLLIPEVMAVMQQTLDRTLGGGKQGRSAKLESLRKQPEAWRQHILVDVIAWLLVASSSKEEQKRLLLLEQDVRNAWKQQAAKWLEGVAEEVQQWFAMKRTKAALREVCTTLELSIPQHDGPGSRDVKQKLLKMVSARAELALDETVWSSQGERDAAITAVRRLIEGFQATTSQNAAQGPPRSLMDSPSDQGRAFDFDGEQVREQEQENEEEAEEKQEHHVEQQEERQHMEAAVQRAYERTDEAPVPWKLSLLTQGAGQASSSSSPFYPLGEFAVNKGVLEQSGGALEGLPSYAMVSDNYYRRTWRMKSLRRLRNVVCFLEWVPDVRKLQRLSMPREGLSLEQRARLKEVFQLYQKSGASSIDGQDLLMLFRSLDVNVEGNSRATQLAGRKLTLEQLEEEVSSQALYRMQRGRYFVALSLSEAEHLRAAMHLMTPDVWPTHCGLALRCLGNREAGLNDSLIDSYGPVLDSVELEYQLEASEQLFRFFNGAVHFQARELSILLRTLQLTRVADRLPWWVDSRSCRRRGQEQWRRYPVCSAFGLSGQGDGHDVATKALLSRLRWALAVQGLQPADAFRMFDAARLGGLRKADFAAGLERLNIRKTPASSSPRWAQQVDALFKLLDKDANEMIDAEEFKAEMELDALDWQCVPAFCRPQTAGAAAGTKLRQAASPQKRDRGGVAANGYAVAVNGVDSRTAAVRVNGTHITGLTPRRPVPPEQKPPVLHLDSWCVKQPQGRFKLKWQRHKHFSPLWATTDADTNDGPLSIWTPMKVVPTGRFSGLKKGGNAVKERLVFGHSLSRTLGPPPDTVLLEVTDVKESGIFCKHQRDAMARLLAALFPHPTGYHLVWKQDSGRSLYLWRAIAPSADFVSLGLLATSEASPPDTQAVRCVPRAWTSFREAPAATPLRSWSSSEGGQRISLWPACGMHGKAAEGQPGSCFLMTQDGAAPDGLHSMDAEKFFVALPTDDSVTSE
eukprot:TRINITY_DN45263_c0_g3_i1.p1 TRINITY_DN45263_c0_g3~~TRINITY_DN45263_c0_g3_i1.p1  ORF type:complete len:2284 (+),score=520.79 TRINITY_DN45263_c0_g3_i1:413-6853(+)